MSKNSLQKMEYPCVDRPHAEVETPRQILRACKKPWYLDGGRWGERGKGPSKEGTYAKVKGTGHGEMGGAG